jgi:desulfoferrodoxin (superoxide reductase-like protein)
MSKDHVDALLKRATQQLNRIRDEYQNSLNNQLVSNDLKIDITEYCMKIRAALDYVGQDISRKYCSVPPKHKVYFPIIKNQKQFYECMKKWYPGLDTTCPTVWSYLDSIQPYNSSFQWLELFNQITNANKHVDFVEQVRKQSVEIRVSGPAKATVEPNTVTIVAKKIIYTGSIDADKVILYADEITFGPGAYINGVPIDVDKMLPKPHPEQKVDYIKWVDFLFKDFNVSVLGLLSQTLSGVSHVVDDIYKLL